MPKAQRPAVGINPNIPLPVQRDLRNVADYAFNASQNADAALAALPGKLGRSENDLLYISSYVSKQIQANGRTPTNLTGLQLSQATANTPGAVKPDGKTITVSNGVLTVPTATSSSLGIVEPDGVIITVTAGAITVAKASSTAFGVVKVDGTTITSTAGVISASAGGGISSQNVVSGSRAYGTVYQNTNTTAMFVSVSTLNAVSVGGNYDVYSDGSNPPTTKIVEVSQQVYGNVLAIQICFWVLPGNYYEVTAASGSPGIDIWTEWH